MVLVRRNDDVTLPFSDLLDLPAEELLTLVDEIGAGVWLDPGTASHMVVPDLRAGDYALVCPIPTGATSLEEVSHDHDGPTHADEGMVHEFSVE